MRHLARYRAAAQLCAVIFIAGCAAQEPQVVAVKTALAPAPVACRKEPPSPPKLPDRAITSTELAKSYNRLQAQYRRQAAQHRLCRQYVARLHRT